MIKRAAFCHKPRWCSSSIKHVNSLPLSGICRGLINNTRYHGWSCTHACSSTGVHERSDDGPASGPHLRLPNIDPSFGFMLELTCLLRRNPTRGCATESMDSLVNRARRNEMSITIHPKAQRSPLLKIASGIRLAQQAQFRMMQVDRQSRRGVSITICA